MHRHESAIGIHMSLPSWTSLPSPTWSYPLLIVTEQGFELPALYSKFPLAVYFTYGNVYVTKYRLLVHPPHWNWLKSIHFYGWVIFHCIYVPQLLYPFICWWTSRLLPCPGFCKHYCNEHWCTCDFLNYGFAQGGVSGSYSKFIPSFLRNLPTVLHTDYIHLHSHQQCKSVPFLHILSII